MAKKKVTQKSEYTLKEIWEYFRIKFNGKERLVKKRSIEKVNKGGSKNQIREENKILRNAFVILGILIVVIFGTYYFVYNSYNFNYKGLDFDTLNENGILFYHTSFPATQDGREVNYNVYLRNDPRKLGREIPFERKGLYLLELFVVNNSESFSCEGDGGISMFNMQQVLDVLGTSLIQDPNASCDFFGRYGYLQIESGEETRIDQFGSACYRMQVNNCEILKVTERFLVDSLVKELGESE